MNKNAEDSVQRSGRLIPKYVRTSRPMPDSSCLLFRNFVDWKVMDLKNEGENEEVTLNISNLASSMLNVSKSTDTAL